MKQTVQHKWSKTHENIKQNTVLYLSNNYRLIFIDTRVASLLTKYKYEIIFLYFYCIDYIRYGGVIYLYIF